MPTRPNYAALRTQQSEVMEALMPSDIRAEVDAQQHEQDLRLARFQEAGDEVTQWAEADEAERRPGRADVDAQHKPEINGDGFSQAAYARERDWDSQNGLAAAVAFEAMSSQGSGKDAQPPTPTIDPFPVNEARADPSQQLDGMQPHGRDYRPLQSETMEALMPSDIRAEVDRANSYQRQHTPGLSL